VAARSGLSSVPPALRRNVVGAWGAAGERWLADLPRLAASVAHDWGLVLGAPFRLSYHCVTAATRWLAIDPRGLVGDPGYDAGALLYNPDPVRRDAGLLDLVHARAALLADALGLAHERVVARGFVTAVLSEVWTAQDGGAPHTRALDVALRLAPFLP